MTQKFFPGANTGLGFYSLFSGIVPPWENRHYTYILKGGPGVGKNTLMKKAACLARANDCTVEEFHCASDPGSLDAVRIRERRLVLLDGTAPHSMDPVMPGVEGEILDLGHFLHREVFARRHDELALLMEENRAHYGAAYACLSAAGALRKAAAEAAKKAADRKMIRDFLRETLTFSEPGGTRRLFLSSPTPDGVVHFRETLGAARTVHLPGLLGTVFLEEAAALAKGTRHTVFPDFRDPSLTEAIHLHGCDTLLRADDSLHSTLGEFLLSPLPDFAEFALRESDRLTQQAVESLRLCKRTHDAIESIYRPFVDFERVDRETHLLLESMKL